MSLLCSLRLQRALTPALIVSSFSMTSVSLPLLHVVNVYCHGHGALRLLELFHGLRYVGCSGHSNGPPDYTVPVDISLELFDDYIDLVSMSLAAPGAFDEQFGLWMRFQLVENERQDFELVKFPT